MAHQDFNDDTKDAGEIGAGHHVTALYELVPPGKEGDLPRIDPLKYTQARPVELRRATSRSRSSCATNGPTATRSRLLEFGVVDEGRSFGEASDDLKFACAVAGFGMLLRDSADKGSLTYAGVLEIAESTLSQDPSGYRREFVAAVRQAQSIDETVIAEIAASFRRRPIPRSSLRNRRPRTSIEMERTTGPLPSRVMSRTLNPEHESWVRDAVARFEGPLTLYAARLLRDAEAARDVVQETFLKLCASDQASIDGHLAEWLFTVCRNRALDVLRKEHRMTQLRDEQVLRCLSPDPGPLDRRRAPRAGLAGPRAAGGVARQSTRGHPAQVPERVFVPGNQPHQRP